MNVEKVFKLAHLKASAEEMEKFSSELTSIISAFEAIKKINTQDVKPLVTPIEIKQYLREDKVENADEMKLVFERAPELMGNLFKTPPVI